MQVHKASHPTYNVVLAGLAMLGDTDSLEKMRTQFVSGKTEGLHSLMTLDAVERALDQASQGNRFQ